MGSKYSDSLSSSPESSTSYEIDLSDGKYNKSRDVFESDDEFWEYYNQLNSEYRSQLDPYLHYNYTPGWKDHIRNALGMRSNEDAVREAAASQAWQMLGNLQNDVFQNTFNSAAAQASRERDAGLNPDLTGTENSDPAAGMEQPITPPQVDFLAPPQTLSQDLLPILEGAAKLVTASGGFEAALAGAGLSTAQAAVAGESANLVSEQIAGAQITNYSSAKDLVDKLLGGIDPDTWKSLRLKADAGEDVGPLIKQHLQGILEPLPASSKKYVNAALDNSTNDPRIMAKYYKAADEANVGAFNMAAGKLVYGNVVDSTLDIITAQNRELLGWKKFSIKMTEKFHKVLSELSLSQTSNQLSYEEWKRKNNVPEDMAASEAAKYITSQYQSEVERARSEVDYNWFMYLDKLTKSHDPEVARKAKFALNQYLVRSSYPLFSRNQGWGFNFGIGEQGIQGGFNRNTGDTSDPTLNMIP